MKLADLLNELNWTQTRLAQKAHISTSTVKRALTGNTKETRVSRDHANTICATLSRALGRKITYLDVDEFHEHQLPLERGPRKPTTQQPGQQTLVDGARPPTQRKRKRRRRHQSSETQEQDTPRNTE